MDGVLFYKVDNGIRYIFAFGENYSVAVVKPPAIIVLHFRPHP